MAFIATASTGILMATLPYAPLPAQEQRAEPVADFEVLDIRYLRRSLSDLSGKRGTCLFFVSNTCPLVLRYLPRFKQLHAEFSERGIRFLAINVGAEDSVMSMATSAADHDMPMPFLKDWDGSAARSCGVTRSCAAVLLDGARRIYYRGRIDQQYRFSGVRPKPGRADLREALSELLAGQPCSKPRTSWEGCAITPRQEPKAPDATWAGDVAALVHRHCAECHRPEGAAPFSLLSYRDVASRGEMIAEVVAQRRMPPWYGSRQHGSFANHRGLEDAEVEKLVGWIRSGMKAGELAQAPKPPAFKARSGGEFKWRIDEPDMVLKLPVKTRLPATGYLPYKYFAFPYRFQHDTWVEQIEILPENPRVLHHANLACVQGLRYRAGNFVTGLVPGGDPMVLDPGTAVLFPKGSTLCIQAHYVTTGKPEVDRLRVGLRFPRQTVQRRLHHLQIGNSRFEIPPHAPHHEVRRAKRIPFDAEGLGLFAHMHLRGKSMRFIAHPPAQDPQTLLLVPNYNFEWQQSYRWAPGSVLFAKGTRILVRAHYDNSTLNPFNPDATQAVRFGDRTEDEMMFGFVFFFRRGEKLGIEVDPKTGRVR